MPPTQQAIKGVLANLTDPKDQLVFQYNPTQVTETKQVNWVEAAIPGGNDTLATFGNGSSLEITLNLFFNSYGEGKRLPNADRLWVENALSFLHRFTEAQQDRSGLRGLAPGILLLVMGDIRWAGLDRGQRPVQSTAYRGSWPGLPVRITRLSVTRSFFSPNDFVTRRAEAAVTLQRHASFPR